MDQLVRRGTATETSAAELPTRITFDRSYFAGSAGEGTRQGLVANANDVRVVDSYFEDFKDTSGDAQAIIAWNGAGPFWIENNYLEASGENVMFGGGDPSIADLAPSDITILGNHFFKPTAWTTERSTRRGSSFRSGNILFDAGGDRSRDYPADNAFPPCGDLPIGLRRNLGDDRSDHRDGERLGGRLHRGRSGVPAGGGRRRLARPAAARRPGHLRTAVAARYGEARPATTRRGPVTR